MKSQFAVLALASALITVFLTTTVQANEIGEVEGQKIVLLNTTTITAIEQALNDSSLTLERRSELIGAALVDDATAPKGFCQTAVEVLGVPGGKPTPERVERACSVAFQEPDLVELLVTGDWKNASGPGETLRDTMSRVISGYILITSMGLF